MTVGVTHKHSCCQTLYLAGLFSPMTSNDLLPVHTPKVTPSAELLVGKGALTSAPGGRGLARESAKHTRLMLYRTLNSFILLLVAKFLRLY